MMRSLFATLAILAMAVPAMGQQCGGNRSVDFGNANLGQQLSLGGGTSTDTSALQAELAALREQVAMQRQNFMMHDDTPVMRTASYKRQAAASSAASTAGGNGAALTQPGGYLTFQEGAASLEQIPPLPNNTCNNDSAELRMQMRALLAENELLRAERQQSSGKVLYLTGQQVSSGGAAASASASTAAPNIGQLALTAPAPVQLRQSQSACSSGGCGGGGRFQFFRGRPQRQVSRSRAISVTSTN